jgi:putative phage-type endonuclease
MSGGTVTDTVTAREEWLEWRRGGLGASDIAGVLGLSPWSSPVSVWARKVGLTGEPDSSEAMRFGRMAEDMLARYLEEDTGLTVDGAQTRVERPDHPWMRCTVDGYGFDGPSRDPSSAVAVVEFKTTADAPEQWTPEVPLHYACQATWTTIVTGHPVVLFGVLHLAFGRPTFRVYEFQPSPDDIAFVTRAATEFWTENVLGGSQPDVDGSGATTEALEEIYSADANLEAVEAPASVALSLSRIAANEERIQICRGIIDEEKNAIRSLMGGATVLTLGHDRKGKPKIVATWRNEHRGGYVVTESTSRVLRVRWKGSSV